jgi:hypothetical protein
MSVFLSEKNGGDGDLVRLYLVTQKWPEDKNLLLISSTQLCILISEIYISLNSEFEVCYLKYDQTWL